MMTQRFNLFYSGYTAFAPTLYFSRLSIAARHANGPHSNLSCITNLKSITESDWDENHSYLKTADSIAKHFGIPAIDLPQTHSDFFPWLNYMTEAFEKEFPMNRIDHYYFLYSRKIAEITCNAGLIKTYIDLQLESSGELDMNSGIEKCLRDTEFILFKLVASAALLSAEPRQAFFNSNYKVVNQDFQPFRQLTAVDMNEAQLKKLAVDMSNYSIKVKEGFKKCIGLLKELQG